VRKEHSSRSLTRPLTNYNSLLPRLPHTPANHLPFAWDFSSGIHALWNVGTTIYKCQIHLPSPQNIRRLLYSRRFTLAILVYFAFGQFCIYSLESSFLAYSESRNVADMCSKRGSLQGSLPGLQTSPSYIHPQAHFTVGLEWFFIFTL
jgi:hypothetical protein